MKKASDVCNIIKMTRRGSFHVTTLPRVQNTNQCGKVGQGRFNYTVIIESLPYLDDHGFVLNNFAVHNYFVDRWKDVKIVPSCERIALDALEHFVKLAARALKIEVTINSALHPEPDDEGSFSGLTAHWELV